MKITDLSVTLFEWPDIPAVRYHAHGTAEAGSSRLGLVTIETDAGITGHAFLGSSLYPADHDALSLVRVLGPVVREQNPLERERLYQSLARKRRTTTWRAIGAVDVALWDIAGKAAGLPVHALLGTYRTAVPAYASSAVLADAAAYAAEARETQAAGWAAYKVHPPGDWRGDIEICRAVRDAVGPDYTLMLDAAWNYRYEEAMAVGRAIEDLNYHWYEDPLPDDDLHGSAKLREKLDIPLVATEYSPGGFTAFAPWILAQATDALRGDVAVKGGITSCIKTAHLAEAFGMNFEVHHGGNSLNNVANLHLVMAIRNCAFFEVLLPDAAQKYGLASDIEVDAEGNVHAPEAPGIGADIDFDLIERRRVEVLR